MEHNFNNEKMNETVAEALGLKEDFSYQLRNDVRDGMRRHDATSSILIETSMGIKNEEFGTGPWEITTYERKLILLGMEMATQLAARFIEKPEQVNYEKRTRK